MQEGREMYEREMREIYMRGVIFRRRGRCMRIFSIISSVQVNSLPPAHVTQRMWAHHHSYVLHMIIHILLSKCVPVRPQPLRMSRWEVFKIGAS